MSIALAALVMIGTVGSEVKVNCKVAWVMAVPSIAETARLKLPSEVGVPEMKPVGGSRFNPGGRTSTVKCVAELPPTACS